MAAIWTAVVEGPEQSDRTAVIQLYTVYAKQQLLL